MGAAMKTSRSGKNLAVVRWSARALGVVTAGFFLFMFIGESLQSQTRPEPIQPIAAVGLVLMGIYIVAMFLGIKWPGVGALLGAAALGSFFVILFVGLLPGNASGGFSLRGVLNPFLLAFWVPILLHLLCWGLESRERERTKAIL